MILGATGTGRSHILGSILSQLFYNYSPDVVRAVFVNQAEGGVSSSFADDPHVSAVVDTSDAAGVATILGEIRAREQLLDEYAPICGAKDAIAYRSISTTRPELNLPVMPYLFIVVDDIDNHEALSRYRAVLDYVAKAGRPLGLRLLVTSQYRAGIPDAIRSSCSYVIQLPAPEGEVGARELLGWAIGKQCLPPFTAALEFSSAPTTIVVPFKPLEAGQLVAV